MFLHRNFYSKILLSLTAFFCLSAVAPAQTFIKDIRRDSARSDKLTGGIIEKTALAAGQGNLRITINVPSFQMTLWQNGKEVKTYPIGIGLKEYPVFIGLREASSIEWNPVWIPPSSDWIEASQKVKAGEIILPTDPRNPLGKVKIPLGYGYLIHQAKGAGDLGNLVSHGCVRVMQKDLYDLAEKITVARALDVTAEEIAAAKRTKKTLLSPLAPVIPVEFTYDTLVVEAGRLRIYPDIYGHKKNTVENLREELKTSRVDASELSDETLRKMLQAANGKTQFVVTTKNIEAGKPLINGQTMPVLANPLNAKPKAPAKKRRR